MSDDERRHAAYLLQLRDDLDRLEQTRWAWVAPAAMSLLTGALCVPVALEGVIPAGAALGLIALATGRHAVRSERDRRKEVHGVLDRIQRIEERRLVRGEGLAGDDAGEG